MTYNNQAFDFEQDAQDFLSEIMEQGGRGHVMGEGIMFVVYWTE